MFGFELVPSGSVPDQKLSRVLTVVVCGAAMTNRENTDGYGKPRSLGQEVCHGLGGLKALPDTPAASRMPTRTPTRTGAVQTMYAGQPTTKTVITVNDAMSIL